MSILVAIILGLVQGLCEFLPISSSGHLMIAEALLGVTGNNLFFNVLLHLASLLSVLIIYRKQIFQILIHPKEKMFWLIVVSTLASCAVVVLIKLSVSELFEITFLGFGFLFSATLILITQKIVEKQNSKLKVPSFKMATVIGLFQGVSALPGISRSASTTCIGQLLGLDRESALDYSFILSIPIIIASMVYTFLTPTNTDLTIGFWPCFIACVATFISSMAAIVFLKKLAKSKSWLAFSIYLFVLATAILIFTFVF